MPSPSRAQSPFAIERFRLANGLRVVLHHEPRTPLASVNLWYHVGSKNERPGQTGFAHLFEHMLFQGSQNVPTNGHFQMVQEVGGSANGSTFYDRTNYYETVPSHHLERALWLESDRMGYLLPAMTQEKLDNQRDVVMNERRQRVDNQPYGSAQETLFELLFGADGHPYRWPVIGYMDDIRDATLEMVHGFFQRYYRPNNAVLTVAGDFDRGDAARMIERHFGPIPAGEPVVQPELAMPILEAERRAELRDRVGFPRVYLGWHVPGFGRHDWYCADLLTTAMASGKSSPAYQDLVYHRRLAQDVTFYVSSTESSAIFLVVATARPGVEAAALEEALSEHVARAVAEPLASEHLERARHRLLITHYADLQSLERRADLMSEFTTYFDDPGRMCSEVERYRDIGADDLQRFASRYLQPDRRVVVTVLPKEAGAP